MRRILWVFLWCLAVCAIQAQRAVVVEMNDRVATGEAGLSAIINQASPVVGCGQPVTLTATITGATEISWKRNGEFINGATTNTFIANQPGTYQVVAISLLCQLESAPVEVILESPLNASIIAPSGPSACEGNSVLLQATGGEALWQWYRNGTILSEANTEQFSASASGSYVVVGNEGSPCESSSQPIEVIIHPLPTVQLSWLSSSTICPGDSATIIASSTAQEQVEWYYEEAPIAGNTGELVATLAGNYHAWITDNNTGCSNWSNELSLVVFPELEISITALTPTEFCDGQSATLAANNTVGYISWFANDQPLENAFDAAITLYSGGNYSAQLTDDNGCSFLSNEVFLEALTLPDATVTFESLFPVLCGADDTLLLFTSEGNSYTWMSESGIIEGEQASELAVVEPGLYSVEVLGANGCSATSASIEVAAFDAPELIMLPSGTVNLCDGQSQLFEAVTPVAGQLLWYVDSLLQEGSTDAFLEALMPGYYQVSIIDDNGCQAFSETALLEVIEVNTPVIIDGGFTAEGQLLLTDDASGHQWYINGEMIPGATGSSLLATQAGYYTCIAIEDICESEVSEPFLVVFGSVSENEAGVLLYPNPASEYAVLEMATLINVGYTLYDISGRVVLSGIINSARTRLQVDALSPGIYRLVLGNGRQKALSIIR